MLEKGKQIQWFPGHMKKASIKIEEIQKFLDFVILIIDARVPFSSYNTFLFDSIKSKPKLLLFTKCDLADDIKTNEWIKYYESAGFLCLKIDYYDKNKRKKIIDKLNLLVTPKREKNLKRGIKRSIFKGVILGIPNVGKSTIINVLAMKSLAKAANMPGVTRNVSWMKINEELFIYDTPGILQPHFEDKDIGAKLALIGSIRQDILPLDYLYNFLIDFLKENYADSFRSYLNHDLNISNVDIINHIGKTRVALLKDGKVNFEGAIRLLLNDFKEAKIAKVTLDKLC